MGYFCVDNFGVFGFGNCGFVFGVMVFFVMNEVFDFSDCGVIMI